MTGGAGFIGSHLCDSLVKQECKVTVLDNFSAGSKKNIRHHLESGLPNIRLVEGDCTNPNHVRKALKDIETVFHFSANPEVRLELNNPETCFQQNVYATYILLQQLKDSPKAHTILYASSSTVYGEATIVPTPETYAPLKPISIYGASKLAGEALVSAYANMYNKKSIILRLANVIGPRSQHGVILDFIKKLGRNPKQLEILGDGTQRKSYIYIADCIKAIQTAWKKTRNQIEIINVGSTDQTNVTRIAEIVTEEIGLTKTEFALTGGVDGGRGWKGDVKNVLLDVTKLRSYGWKPELNSEQAVMKATKRLISSFA